MIKALAQISTVFAFVAYCVWSGFVMTKSFGVPGIVVILIINSLLSVVLRRMVLDGE